MSELIHGDIRKVILSLSWPTQVAFVLQAAFNLVDTIYIGRVSPDAIAALSLAFPVFVVMFSLAGGVGVGTTSLVARYLGAKRHRKANSVAQTSFLLAFVSTIAFMVLGYMFVEPLYIWMGAADSTLELALSYTRTVLWGSVFMFFMIAASSIIRGEGDTRTPMKYMIISSVINIVLDPLLIFGFWDFPKLGAQGAAIATNISVAVGCYLSIRYLFKKKEKVRISLRGFRLDGPLIKRILEIGIPSSIAQSFMALGIIFLTKIVSTFGSDGIASYGIGYRLDMLAVLPALGITLTMVTIVGHNIGAKKYFRAIKATINGSVLVAIQMGLVGLLFYLFPELFMQIFTNQKEVIKIGADYLSTVGLTYGLIGIGMVIGAAFQGAGSATPLLAITLARLVVLPIPIAYAYIYFISESINGVWNAIAIANILSAVLAVGWLLLSSLYRKALASREGSSESFF